MNEGKKTATLFYIASLLFYSAALLAYLNSRYYVGAIWLGCGCIMLTLGAAVQKKIKVNPIKTKRLTLRGWRVSDAEELYKYAKESIIGENAGWFPHKSVEESREIIETVLTVNETYAICFDDDKPIGSISLVIGKRSFLDLPKNEAEIGFWLGVPYWGQGIMPEAVNALIRHAFEDLKMEKLWCGYFDGNERSKRVQEKCGFVFNYTKKDVLWEQTNEIKTEHIMLLTKEDYLKQKK